MKKTDKQTEGSPAHPPKSPRMNHRADIKTDLPLIEKDEVKQAEERMRKASKKQ